MKCIFCGRELINTGIRVDNLEFFNLERCFNSQIRFKKAMTPKIVKSLNLNPEELYRYFINNWTENIEASSVETIYREGLSEKYHMDMTDASFEGGTVYFHKDDINGK